MANVETACPPLDRELVDDLPAVAKSLCHDDQYYTCAFRKPYPGDVRMGVW